MIQAQTQFPPILLSWCFFYLCHRQPPRTLNRGTTVKAKWTAGWSGDEAAQEAELGPFIYSLFPNTWNPWPWWQGAGKPGGSSHNICDWEGETPTPFTTTQAPIPVIFPLVTAAKLPQKGQTEMPGKYSKLTVSIWSYRRLEYQLFPCTQESFFFFFSISNL